MPPRLSPHECVTHGGQISWHGGGDRGVIGAELLARAAHGCNPRTFGGLPRHCWSGSIPSQYANEPAACEGIEDGAAGVVVALRGRVTRRNRDGIPDEAGTTRSFSAASPRRPETDARELPRVQS